MKKVMYISKYHVGKERLHSRFVSLIWLMTGLPSTFNPLVYLVLYKIRFLTLKLMAILN